MIILIKFFVLLFILTNTSFGDEQNNNQYYIRSLRYFSQSITKEILIIASESDFNSSSKLYGFNNKNAKSRLEIISKLFDKIDKAFLDGEPDLKIEISNDKKWNDNIIDIDRVWKEYYNIIQNINDKNYIKNNLKEILDLDDRLLNLINNYSIKYDNLDTISQRLMTINQIICKNFYLIAIGHNIDEMRDFTKQLIKDYVDNTDIIKIKYIQNFDFKFSRYNILFKNYINLINIALYKDHIDKKYLVEMTDLNLKMLDEIKNIKT